MRRDLEALDDVFPVVRLHYPEFVFLSLFDRQVFRYRWASVSRLIGSLDRAAWRRLPPVRRFSYYLIIEMVA